MADSSGSTVTVTSGMRQLFPFARPARVRLALSGLVAVGATLLELALFYVVYVAVEAVVAGDVTAGSLYRLALAGLACVAGRYGLFALALWISHVAAYDILHRLRIEMAEHLARVPLGYFTARRSGDLKKVMVDDVERLELFLAHAVPDLVSAAVVWVGATIWLFVIDWRLALATIAVVPAAFYAMSTAMRRSSTRMGEYHEAQTRMNASLVEFLRGMPVIKMFNRSGDAFRETSQAIDDYVALVRQWCFDFLPRGTAYYTLIGANVLVLVPVGLALYLAGQVAAPALLLFFILGIGYSAPLARLMELFNRLAHLTVGGNLVREVLAGAELAEASHTRRARDASVEFREVSFGYDGSLVLHDVSFVARPGTVTALVGPSGSGKTTLARLVPRFWDVDAGQVLVGGVDVRDMSIEDLMSQVAFVFQETFLFDDTVEANLRVGNPDATRIELEAAARAARALDFVEALPEGWATRLGERGVRLSGGEKQRLALARAILKNAPITVLDEATAFADPENETAIQEAIGSLVAGRTVVMIAHRLSTVAGAHQILVLDGGRIVERGRHPGLLALGGTYARLWSDFVAAESTSLGSAVHGGARDA